MTDQEAYDKACAHLAQQKTRAVTEFGRCAYYVRDSKRRCAIGGLMPKAMAMRCQGSIGVLIHQDAGVRQLFEGCSAKLLADLQCVHDWASSHSNAKLLRTELKKAARHHGITPGAEEAITEWH